MITVGVLYGGRSGEHDVSLCSAASVVASLDRSKYEVVAIGIDRDGRWYVQDEPVIVDDKDFGRKMNLERKGNWTVNHYEKGNALVLHDSVSNKEVAVDVVFPVIHGTFCEDGTLQGLLELAMVPYVGADVAGSAIGMDKDVSKRLLRDGGIPVVPWKVITHRDWSSNRKKIAADINDAFAYPLFVKPCSTGSSVGVKKVNEPALLEDSVDFALRYDNKIMIEDGITAREIECAVLGNDDPEASYLGEIIPKHEFYSYEAKYIDSQGAELVIPANIDEFLSAVIREAAVQAFRILNCSGMARVDFFLERGSSNYYLNEINTLPGFTSISMYPKLWEYTGLSYARLLDKLIDLARQRHAERKRISTEFAHV